MRRNRIKIFVAAALALVLALGCFAALAETLTVRFDLEYRYDMTQAMLPIINEYRTSDTWYWNKTDTEKIPVTGLNALIYDYGLEQIAMKRAAECALVFSHTRPNEQKWSTLYTTYNLLGNAHLGENIAGGHSSMASVMNSWWEESCKYDGQGHRRNILMEDFKYVGVGCVLVDGTLFWAQEFSSVASGVTSRTKLTGPAVIDGTESMMDSMKNLASAEQPVKLNVGQTRDVPAVNSWIVSVGSAPITLTSVPWVSADSSIAKVEKVSGQNKWTVTGVKAGHTTLSYGSAVTKGKEIITVDVHVRCASHKLTRHAQVNATCTAEGTGAYRSCSVCGLLFSDTNTSTEISAPPVLARLSHTLTAHGRVEATCTEDGTEAYWSCSSCGGLFSDEEGETKIDAPAVIKATGHRLSRHNRVEATCTAPGTELYWSCTRCGALFSDSAGKNPIDAPAEIAVRNHTMIYHAGKNATCTEPGNKYWYSCNRCGALFADSSGKEPIDAPVEIPAAHNLQRHYRVSPTCEKDGTEAYWECRACGRLFSDEAGTTEIDEPEVLPRRHLLSYHAPVKATCSEEGVSSYFECRACGKLFSDSSGTEEIEAPVPIPAPGHRFVYHYRVQPTCTEPGTESYYACSACGMLLTGTGPAEPIDAPAEIPALGHLAVTDPPVRATLTSTGLTRGSHCSRCGEILVAQQVVPKLDPDNPPDPEDLAYLLLPGDVNTDGEVDGRDVVLLMKHLAGEIDPETGEVFEIFEDNADVTGDGRVDSKDLLRLVKYLAGEDVTLEEKR